MDLNKKEALARAQRAKQLLEDPMIQDIINGMRTTVFNNFRTSKWDNQEEREQLYQMIRSVDCFEEEFKKIIKKGMKAAHDLNQKDK